MHRPFLSINEEKFKEFSLKINAYKYTERKLAVGGTTSSLFFLSLHDRYLQNVYL
jgi:hypothetical protein